MNNKSTQHDWDNFRIFLAVCRSGSFLRAAEQLKISQPTVSRKIAELEASLGAKLFDRLSQGTALTPTGERIKESTESMENLAGDIQTQAQDLDQALRGTVRITATEGLAHYWLTPRLMQFRDIYPQISLDIDASGEVRDLSLREADIALRFNQPTQHGYRFRKVRDIIMRPYATTAYIAKHGLPTTVDALAQHFIVEQSNLPDTENWQPWREAIAKANRLALTSTSSVLLGSAIRNGFGIGLMPTRAPMITSELIQIPIEIGPTLSLYVVSHENTNQTGRVRATLDYLHDMLQKDEMQYYFQ